MNFIKIFICLFLLVIINTLNAQRPQLGWTFDPENDTFSENAMLDLRYLNEAEAGQSGFIGLSADGNSFVDGNGDPIKFWASGGAGVTADLNDTELAYYAKFLAKRGVNIIRYHAEISPDETIETDINNPNMEEIDHIWRAVAAFKQEGIYTVISPFWANNIKSPPASWGLGDYTDNDGGVWGLLFFDDVLKEAYKSWVSVLYGQTNPYTGIALKDDPAVAIIQIQNEDGLFFWTIQGVEPSLLAKMENEFYLWLIDKYTTIEEAYTAWGGDTNENDDPNNNRMGIEIIYHATLAPENLKGISHERLTDQVQFMAEHQRDFYGEIYDYYRNTIGCQQLINTTNWKTASSLRLFDLERWTNDTTEVLAVNRYVSPTHVNFTNPSYDGYRIDPGDYYEGESALVNPNKLPINIKQVEGHPFLVTESGWNLPHKYQAEGPWLIAAYSSLNGIDGYFWFSPSHQGYDDNPYYDFWREYEDIGTYPMFRWTSSIPGTTAMYPANAYIFRKGLIKEAETVVHEERTLQSLWEREVPVIAEENGFDPNRDSYGNQQDPSETEVIPFAFLTGKVETVYGEGESTVISSQINSLVDITNKTVGSVTGELNWDYGKGITTMSAPLAQGAVGFFSDGETPYEIELPEIKLSVKNEYAAINVVAMDDTPLANSGEIFVQIGTVYQPTNWLESAAQFEPSEGDVRTGYKIINTGKMPWKAAKSLMTIEFKNPNIKSAHMVGINGEKQEEIILFPAENGVKIYVPTNAMYIMLNTDEPGLIAGTNTPDDAWSVYPNPSDGAINITLSKNIRGQVDSIKLIDIKGRSLIDMAVKNKDQFIINRSGLNPGVYVLVLKDGEKIIDHRKVILK